ncbi:MAG TPA: polysaccharide lyase family 7 protein [Lutibacter sp.]|nr:polysaccharide lyase family 7 protein [Lutibacter sp.]
MKKNCKKLLFYKRTLLLVLGILLLGQSCGKNEADIADVEIIVDELPDPIREYADIDFSHWKITLPVDLNNDNKPDEFQPSSLINYSYQKEANLKQFMFDDTTDTSIVFYNYPAGATTANSSYPRTELREQQTPGDNYNNWSLSEGGIMEGTLKVQSISKDNVSSREYHRVIVMQIHGIISQADMSTYGFEANLAPPLLKMIWDEGNILAYKKTLVSDATTGKDLYDDSTAWTDIKHDFGSVAFNKFTIKIVSLLGKLSVTVNNKTHVFEDISLQKWPFENYFKAGNYLMATETNAFAKIKYYKLEISH